MANPRRSSKETGAALLITLFALSLFAILGLYMALNATTGLHISDNYESQTRATYAALAGLNHARSLLRGLTPDDCLKGPDGRFNEDSSYLDQAKNFRFRLPLSVLTAQAMDILNPSPDISGIPDDGLINTGFYDGTNGTVLIPIVGISQMVPNPYGAGEIPASRYFVKVTDNNGETSEIMEDSEDNPFVDGDGILIIRSMGVAKTISESTGLIARRNSVAVFETRLKRMSTWDLGPALVVLGTGVAPTLSGSYEISGGISPGVGTIDAAPEDAISLEQIVREAAEGNGVVTGGDLPSPSVLDITARIRENPDQSLLLNARYLWDFIRDQAPTFTDNYYDGSQNWIGGSAPYTGFYDSTKPANAPEQDPKITFVNGDLSVTGNFSGGGLLIVTGNFSCSGPYEYNGLILVIGSGNLTAAGSGQGIEGGIVIANLMNSGGGMTLGAPCISVSGNSRFISNREVVKMAIGLIPASQISFREIAGSDP
jgi:hypothetical protein